MSSSDVANNPIDPAKPLESLEHWDEFLQSRYPAPASASEASAVVTVSPAVEANEAAATAASAASEGNGVGENGTRGKRLPSVGTDPNKTKEEFRSYEAEVRPSVREFYRQNHIHQTYDFVQAKRAEFLRLDRMEMGIWEAMEYLNQLVDDSDPDTDLSQLQHLLQTAEAMRRDGQPRWMILTGLVHDLGKILCLWGEPQWAVVGDTFVTGCPHSDKVVFSEYFAQNPDSTDARFNASPNGVYEPGCGLDKLALSWGHDEYIYHVCKDYLPEEGLYMLRYHSFYPWHREGAYNHLANDKDRAMLPWILKFNTYDLYTKSHEGVDVAAVRPYYEELIREFFPEKVRW